MSDNSENRPRFSRQPGLTILLLISFALFNLAFIIDQTIRRTDHFAGFINGICHIIVMGVAWCFWCLPWSLMVFLIYRWRGWKRFRTHWILAPAIFAFVDVGFALIANPPTAGIRFETHAHTPLPDNAHNLRFCLSGGGVADYHDVYYFETSAEEVERLIEELRMTPITSPEEEEGWNSATRFPGWPDFRTWNSAKQFRSENDDWFYYLIVDESKTRVYVSISGI